MEASWEQSVTHSINTIYLLFSAYLVFVMQTGLAMICAGSVRAENAMNIMLNNVVDAVVWPIGFGHPVVGQVQGQVSCSWAQEPLTLLGVRVVHMVGAIAGFWGSIIEGPHVGRFDAFGKPVPLQGHNATLVITRLQLVKLLLSPHWPDRRLAPSPCSGDDY
ncbi:Ammonium transporter 1 member [Arachis hypogaea]|nr:Ammonium transporter 1 member [Arachis hypogaea]